ncbi:hypothetical protein GOP47_0013695 [Adiantum capillus-veneris]|uniref:Uncharacterized protein n=1 Tax=Adiantum capillus-veneris TaxID=13818 RepID=A0A9D4UPI9_ADICA|nr:hypothetical protein GOP47_0013695 [Adiantum capillus-veneris]
MGASRLCTGLWAVTLTLLQATSALHPSEAENSDSMNRQIRRQLVVSSETIQDGTVRATTILPRRDPLNSLRLYEGGFNMKDRYYWSSVAFTGIWAFSLAFVCLAAGTATSLWWSWDKDSGMTSVLPAHSDILRGLYCFCIVQFSILAITSSGVIFWGTYQSGKEIKDSTNVIVSQVNQVVNQVEHAVFTIEGATSPLMSDEVIYTIQSACDRLNGSATDLQSNFKEGKKKFYNIFNKLKALLTFAAAMIPMIVLTGLVAIIKVWCRILRVSFTIMTIVLCASWVLSGVCFILSNVATDACQAMKSYERSPESSSFSKVLPCLRPVEATNALNTAKSAIKNLISQMNGAIDLVNGREELMKLQYANGSFGITLKHFCDPFGPPPDYLEGKCSANQSNFSTFETDYDQYRCAEDVVRHCFESSTPIPNSYYTQFIISISAAKEVITLLPALYGILTCAFIKKAFQDLTANHCSSIEAALNTLWIAFAAASVAMMSVQVMWIAIRKHLTVKKDFKLQFMYSPFG